MCRFSSYEAIHLWRIKAKIKIIPLMIIEHFVRTKQIIRRICFWKLHEVEIFASLELLKLRKKSKNRNVEHFHFEFLSLSFPKKRLSRPNRL